MAMQRTAAQVYEREPSDSGPEQPLQAIGRISDVYWDDPDNRFLRGFTLVDPTLGFGKGLCILSYYHQPYVEPQGAPPFAMGEYDEGKYVRCTFEVFDTYEEAVG